MSINPLAAASSSIVKTSGLNPESGKTSDAFDALLDSKSDSSKKITPSDAVSLAELARLEQMRIAINPFSNADQTFSMLYPEKRRSKSAADAFRQNSDLTEKRAEQTPDVEKATFESRNQIPVQGQKNHIHGSLESIIKGASKDYGVDENLIKAVIKAESNFNKDAVSKAGAKGLMQLMPATARSLGVSDPFDPAQNVRGGTRFLRDLLKKYDGNIDQVLAAYNWGPGNVDKKLGRLPSETRTYISRVKSYYSETG